MLCAFTLASAFDFKAGYLNQVQRRAANARLRVACCPGSSRVKPACWARVGETATTTTPIHLVKNRGRSLPPVVLHYLSYKSHCRQEWHATTCERLPHEQTPFCDVSNTVRFDCVHRSVELDVLPHSSFAANAQMRCRQVEGVLCHMCRLLCAVALHVSALGGEVRCLHGQRLLQVKSLHLSADQGTSVAGSRCKQRAVALFCSLWRSVSGRGKFRSTELLPA